ncbi:MAG TPA: hypothetical protein VL361_13855 [Candidatus Limnocylindrales bacterium]|jgi:hypothetical protein|nr:hypothetical protein [Candidatus Limnocylindrales bacterium]
MSKTYMIQWKSKINGRAGKGTKQFSLDEAESLVRELNFEYPNIHHEIVDAQADRQPDPEASNHKNQAPAIAPPESDEEKAPYHAHAFSE